MFEKQLNEIYDIVKNRRQKVHNIEAQYYQELLTAKQNPQITMKWFHKLTPDVMCDVALGILDQQLSIYTPLERKTFDEDPNKLKKFLATISHLDEVVDKITGDVLIKVQTYTECPASKRGFHRCFTEAYTRMGGKQNVVTYVRYTQAYSSTPYQYCESQEYLDFQLKMDKYVFPESE